MPDESGRTAAFEGQRSRLRAVAYRVLGSTAEADDAVQEAWLRWQRTGPAEVDDPDAWLTTVTVRICLNLLRARGRRREDPLDEGLPAPLLSPASGVDPEQEALLGDAVGLALVVVLQTLGPAERVAFVLHDLFAVPFEEVGALLERSPAAARQLASRARRRVRDQAPAPDQDLRAQRAVVDAFYAAARHGDVEGLVAVLHPAVVLRSDAGPGRRTVLRGAHDVAGQAALAARLAPLVRPVLVHGTAGAAVVVDGRVRTVMAFTVVAGQILTLEVLQDPRMLAGTVGGPPLASGVPSWVDTEQPDGAGFGWWFRPAGPGATSILVNGYGDHLAATSDPGIRDRQAAAPPGFADVVAGMTGRHADEPAHWHVVFSVDDRDRAAARAVELGGVLLGTGESAWTRPAQIRDPQGATLTLSELTPPH